MKSFSKIGTEALKKFFDTRVQYSAVLSQGSLTKVPVEASKVVTIVEQEIDLTTPNFDKLQTYQIRNCYQWSIGYGLEELKPGKQVKRIRRGWDDGYDDIRYTERIGNTLGDAIFENNKNCIGYRDLMLKHISHVVLEYQISPNNFKIFIYVLSDKILESIAKGSIEQTVFHNTGKVVTVIM